MCSNLGETLFREREQTGDFELLVGSEVVRAHRCVLALYCPYYKSVSTFIVEGGISVAAFNEFLRFFYLKEARFSEDNVEPILKLAMEASFDECIDQCEQYLSSILDVKKVCKFYQLAVQFDLLQLNSNCASTIASHTAEVLASEAFLKCHHRILLRILSLDILSCQEIDLLNACISWAKSKTQKTCYVNKSQHSKHLRTMLNDAVRLIRFASISVKEFYDLNLEYNGFFKPEECVEITGIICGKRLETVSQKFTMKHRQKPNEVIAIE